MEFWAHWVFCAYYRFLGLSKGPTFILRWLAKFSSSSFYSACGDRVLKQIRKVFRFFKLSAHVYSLLGQNEGKRSFLEGIGKNSARWDYPKQHLVFMRLKKFLLQWNLNNLTPPLLFLEPHTTKYYVDKFCR